jgi:hypothetical protein
LPSREALLEHINHSAGRQRLRKHQLVAHYLEQKVELDVLLPYRSNPSSSKRCVQHWPIARKCRAYFYSTTLIDFVFRKALPWQKKRKSPG